MFCGVLQGGASGRSVMWLIMAVMMRNGIVTDAELCTVAEADAFRPVSLPDSGPREVPHVSMQCAVRGALLQRVRILPGNGRSGWQRSERLIAAAAWVEALWRRRMVLIHPANMRAGTSVNAGQSPKPSTRELAHPALWGRHLPHRATNGSCAGAGPPGQWRRHAWKRKSAAAREGLPVLPRTAAGISLRTGH